MQAPENRAFLRAMQRPARPWMPQLMAGTFRVLAVKEEIGDTVDLAINEQSANPRLGA